MWQSDGFLTWLEESVQAVSFSTAPDGRDTIEIDTSSRRLDPPDVIVSRIWWYLVFDYACVGEIPISWIDNKRARVLNYDHGALIKSWLKQGWAILDSRPTTARPGWSNKEFLFCISEWLNKTTVYNKHIIERALDVRPKDVPLITVSNHHSCFDDPGIWGKLFHSFVKCLSARITRIINPARAGGVQNSRATDLSSREIQGKKKRKEEKQIKRRVRESSFQVRSAIRPP